MSRNMRTAERPKPFCETLEMGTDIPPSDEEALAVTDGDVSA